MTDELKEKIVWQNINSSKEKGKILTGKITAIETERMKDKGKRFLFLLMFRSMVCCFFRCS